MMNKKLLVLLPVLGVFAAVGFAGIANAQVQVGASAGVSAGMGGMQGGGGMNMNMQMHGGMMMGGNGVVGMVTAVNGTTLTVQSTVFSTSTRATSTVDYSVDASNATVRKNNATSTISSVMTGDRVFVRGTISGDSVTATSIIDGQVPMMGGRGGFGRGPWNGSSSASGTMQFGPGPRRFQGNGSGTMPFASSTPAVVGTVAAVNGNSLTVTGSNGTTYTVDITNAVLVKQGNATSTISGINVGDNVRIEGTVNGTSVTATAVIDDVTSTTASGSSQKGGFFGALRSLFSNIFHFHF